MKKLLKLFFCCMFALLPSELLAYGEGARLSDRDAMNAISRHGASTTKGNSVSGTTGGVITIGGVNTVETNGGEGWLKRDENNDWKLRINYVQAREIISRWIVGDKSGGGSNIQYGQGSMLDEIFMQEVIIPDEELSEEDVAKDDTSNNDSGGKLKKKKHKAHAFFSSKAKADKFAKSRPGSKVVPFRKGWRVEQDISYYVDKATGELKTVMVYGDKVEVNKDKTGTLLLKHTPVGAILKYGQAKSQLALLATDELNLIYHVRDNEGYVTEAGLRYLAGKVFAIETNKKQTVKGTDGVERSVEYDCNPYTGDMCSRWWNETQRKRFDDLLSRFEEITEWHYPCTAKNIKDEYDRYEDGEFKYKRISSGECITKFRNVQVSETQARVLAGIWALQNYGTEVVCEDSWSSGAMVEKTKGVDNSVKYREWDDNKLNTKGNQDYLSCKTIDGAHDLQFEFNDMNETSEKKVRNEFLYALQNLVGGEVRSCNKTANKVVSRKFRLVNNYMNPTTKAYANTKEEAIRACNSLSANLAPYVPYGSNKFGQTKYFVEEEPVFTSSGNPSGYAAADSSTQVVDSNLVCYYATGVDSCGDYNEETEEVTLRNDLKTYGIKTDAFSSLKIRYTPETKNLIHHYVDNMLNKSGKKSKEFSCSPISQNGVLRCMVQISGDTKRYDVDFEFTDTLRTDDDLRGKADREGMSCLVSGGQYDGKSCQGIKDKKECDDFAAQMKVKTEWYDHLGLCVLPNATSATYLDESKSRFVAGVAMLGAVLVAIPTGGATMYGLILIAGADFGQNELKLNAANELQAQLTKVNNENTQCVNKSLNEEQVKQCNLIALQDLNKTFSDVNKLVEDQNLLKALDATFAKYIVNIPDRDFERMGNEWGKETGGAYTAANQVLVVMKTVGVVMGLGGFFKNIVNFIKNPSTVGKKLLNPKDTFKNFSDEFVNTLKSKGGFVNGKYKMGFVENLVQREVVTATNSVLKSVKNEEGFAEAAGNLVENTTNQGVTRLFYANAPGSNIADANWLAGQVKEVSDAGLEINPLSVRTAGAADGAAVKSNTGTIAGEIEDATGSVMKATGKASGSVTQKVLECLGGEC